MAGIRDITEVNAVVGRMWCPEPGGTNSDRVVARVGVPTVGIEVDGIRGKVVARIRQ